MMNLKTQTRARKLPKLDTHGKPVEAGKTYWWDAWRCAVVPIRKGRSRKLYIDLKRPGTTPVEVTAALAGTLAPYEVKAR